MQQPIDKIVNNVIIDNKIIKETNNNITLSDDKINKNKSYDDEIILEQIDYIPVLLQVAVLQEESVKEQLMRFLTLHILLGLALVVLELFLTRQPEVLLEDKQV